MHRALEGMISNHAAAGRLQSGATAIEALRIFEEYTTGALDQTLAEAGKLIEHRGWKWKAAMNGIAEGLHDHLGRTREYLDRPLSIAGIERTPSAAAEIDRRIAAASGRLTFKLVEFRDGWTAPAPKLWKDRNPFIYAIVLLVAGATIGASVTAFAGKLGSTIAAP